MKKVSVVIPVYNAEKHLGFCLDGIIAQTYKNIEIITVDDGSTDSSPQILDGYKEKHPDIFKVIHQKNAGVFAARNAGIAEADGYYLMFSDNDDFMEPDFIENMVNTDCGYDIIIGGYKRMEYSGKELFRVSLKEKPLSPFIQLASWGKLYNAEFVKKNNLQFRNVEIADDFFFNISAYSLTDKIKIVPQTQYYWMFNAESLSNTDSKALNRTDGIIKALEDIKNNIHFNDKQLIEYFYIRTAVYYILFSCKGTKKEQIYAAYEKLFNWISENTAKKNKYLSLFGNYGEQPKVKIIIAFFRLLQRLGLAKLAVLTYSKL